MLLRIGASSPEWVVIRRLTDITSGNALTDNFFQDVGITQFQFNTGQQLLSAGIVLLEVLSAYAPFPLPPLLLTGV